MTLVTPAGVQHLRVQWQNVLVQTLILVHLLG